MIDRFDGEYAFLSNFYHAPVLYKNVWYQNNEAAFQAQKTLSSAERIKFTALNPSEAKRLGRSVTLRPDWEAIKTQVMYEVCLAKFEQNHELREKLLKTGSEELIEGNTWRDTCWGVCNGIGENRLGKILMEIREKFQGNE